MSDAIEMNEAQKYLDASADLIGQTLDTIENDLSMIWTKLSEKWGGNYEFTPANMTQGDIMYKLAENSRTAARVALAVAELTQYAMGLRSDPV